MNTKSILPVSALIILGSCCLPSAHGGDANATTNVAIGGAFRPAGAIVLWNGRDLSGWKTYFTNAEVNVANVWSASNGVLHLAGKPNGYLKSAQAFSNYQFHVEWRWPQTNGNSGVFVHITGDDVIWPVSVECQLKIGSAGELVGQGGVDFVAPLINGKKRAKIKTSSEHPVGDWNAYDITCHDTTIEARVNGILQNRIEQVTATNGAVGLQLEGHPVEFRNVWLKPL